MFRKAVCGIMLSLLLIGVFYLAVNIKPVKGEWTGTVYIRADGSIDPPDAPIITYDNITYTLSDDIEGSDLFDVIIVERNDIVIDGAGHTVRGGVSGVYLKEVVNVTLKNLNIKSPLGIDIEDSSYNYLIGNNITDGLCGVQIFRSNNNYLISNNITNCHGMMGVPGPGIIIWLSANNTVINNNIANNDVGVWLHHLAKSNRIVNNIIRNNVEHGIYFYSSSNNVVDENVIANNKVGIHLKVEEGDICSNNIITNNIITNNGWSGLDLYATFGAVISDNVIQGNNITNNPVGIFMDTFYATCSNNIIRANNIKNNWIGIDIWEASNNKIYHNNFLDNDNQIYSESVNVWDDGYPSGGNYWSNYKGVDYYSGPYQNITGSDGLGDTPYVIDANNNDRYPLMHPWSSLPVHNINTGLGYATIQEAINAPETLDGHIIFAEAGTYYENYLGLPFLVITKNNLTIIGENVHDVVVNASIMSGHPKVDGIAIKNLTVNGDIYFSIDIYEARETKFNNFVNIIVNGSIQLEHASSSSVISSEVRGGIMLYCANNVNIIQNNITSEGRPGIDIAFSSGINISENIIFSCQPNAGIDIAFSSGNKISENIITNCSRGISMSWSTENIIFKNTLIQNLYGIDLYDADFNLISGNLVLGNHVCIELTHSNNNTLYHNNFISDSPVSYWLIGANAWDDGYPSGGNYWSDYAGVDNNGDGIGDTPYVIDENNIDRYPLMNPWGTGTPVASFTWTPSVPEVGGVVTFDASASMPIGGEIISYEWDFGDGTHATGKIVTHVYGSARTFSVTLNVTDSEGLWDIEQRQIEVKAPPPPLTVSISPTSASILVGQSVTFTSTVTGGYTPYSYQWYLNGNPVSGATSPTWTFTPTTSGIYYVNLKVTDGKGNTAQSETARIAVASVPVGGYSIPIQVHIKTELITLYIALLTILTTTYTTIKRKTKRKQY